MNGTAAGVTSHHINVLWSLLYSTLSATSTSIRMSRVPAVEIETLGGQSRPRASQTGGANDDAAIAKSHLARVEVQANQLVVHYCLDTEAQTTSSEYRSPLLVPCHKTSSVRRREILPPADGASQPRDVRPIRSETRATLVASIARGRAWLDEMTADPKVFSQRIASSRSLIAWAGQRAW